MPSLPGLHILRREFNIVDISFAVTGSIYLVLVLLFFMYAIGSGLFGPVECFMLG